MTPCPCGGAEQETCCGPFLDGKTKPETPEQLMRSRYTAYALRRPLYLRETWHPRTRPRFIELGTTAWLGLTIVHSGTQDDSHGTVEFVARYRERGQVHELREHSRFEKLRGGWLYVDALD